LEEIEKEAKEKTKQTKQTPLNILMGDGDVYKCAEI
jgi:hypothetical protein